MSLVVGPRLIWVVNRAAWGAVMQQVCRIIAPQGSTDTPTVPAAGDVVDLHHLSNGPRPRSAQFGVRRSVVFTVRSQVFPMMFIIIRKMYPTTDSSDHLMDIPLDNYGWVKSNAVICALLQNDDVVNLRSIIRRTRGVRLVSKGTLYERTNDVLEEAINGVWSGTRSALSDHVTPLDPRRTLPEEHQPFAESVLALVLRETRKVINLAASSPTFHHLFQHTELPLQPTPGLTVNEGLVLVQLLDEIFMNPVIASKVPSLAPRKLASGNVDRN
jgi:hypothetical protein